MSADGGGAMKRLLIASVVMVVGGLTGCAADSMDGRSEAGRISGEFLLLILVAVVLYLAFSGVVALVARRSPQTGHSFDLAAGRALLPTSPDVMAQHQLYGIEQGIGPDRLPEERDRTGLPGSLARFVVVVSSQNDHRNSGASGRQVTKQIKAIHPAHPQIEHQTAGVLLLAGAQELFR